MSLEKARFVFTHVFDFYYKWCPTASVKIVSGWPNDVPTVSTDWNSQGLSMINATYNNGLVSSLDLDTIPILTREPAAISSSAGALPWGSPAADYLWNCLVPSQSGFNLNSIDRGGGNFNNTMTFTFTYNSASYYYGNGNGFTVGKGLSTYPITSSWKAIEPLMTASNMIYKTAANGVGGATIQYPATILQPTPSAVYAQPSAHSSTIPGYQDATTAQGVQATLPNGTNPGMITYGNASTGSSDGRFYDLAGGIGISRQDVSASLVEYAASGSTSSTAARLFSMKALKKRRLFFPTIEAESAGNTSTASPTGVEWAANLLVPTDQLSDTRLIFNTNGGIFNVKFNLKRNISIDMFPDSTEGSELLIYIFDINRPTLPAPPVRPIGTPGFYPPDNNIIRVKNTTPEMSFINPATGFLMETFNLNVIQYGLNAQLVFEASGSLANDGYFGCIIDDIAFCQVGVSTDPNLLAPVTIGDTVNNQADPGSDTA